MMAGADLVAWAQILAQRALELPAERRALLFIHAYMQGAVDVVTNELGRIEREPRAADPIARAAEAVRAAAPARVG